jgi:hypothetical protein
MAFRIEDFPAPVANEKKKYEKRCAYSSEMMTLPPQTAIKVVGALWLSKLHKNAFSKGFDHGNTNSPFNLSNPHLFTELGTMLQLFRSFLYLLHHIDTFLQCRFGHIRDIGGRVINRVQARFYLLLDDGGCRYMFHWYISTFFCGLSCS